MSESVAQTTDPAAPAPSSVPQGTTPSTTAPPSAPSAEATAHSSSGGAGNDGASPATGQGAAAQPDGSPAQPAAPGPSQDPAELPDWARRTIETSQARAAEYYERLRQIEAGAQAPAASGADPAPTPVPDIEALVQARVAARVFEDQCNTVAAEGRGKFTDFDKRLSSLVMLARAEPALGTGYHNMVKAAIATGQAADLIHRLGADPGTAEKILRMDATRQAVELARMAGTAATVSNAPKPIVPTTPVGGRGDPVSPSDPAQADKLSISEWMARRNAEVKTKRTGRAA